MNPLKTYLESEAPHLTAAEIAAGLKPPVTSTYVYALADSRRPFPPKRAAQIDVLTDGRVARQAMRPDDWREIWPELAQRVDAEQGKGRP